MNNHPLDFIREASIAWNVSKLEYSRYEYVPQSLLDNRTIGELKISELDILWLQNESSLLAENEDIAIHSIMRKHKKIYHIPMVDFSCPVSELDIARQSLERFIPKEVCNSFVFYDSGRSLHAYGGEILSNNTWRDFMGRLLLMNMPNKKPIVDTRWVGHRLMAGYSSLRLTANNAHYLKIPTEILRM